MKANVKAKATVEAKVKVKTKAKSKSNAEAQSDVTASVKAKAAPRQVWSVTGQKSLEARYADGRLEFTVDLKWADYILIQP